MSSYFDMLLGRREEILARMDSAVRESGRTLDDVVLAAVSKTVGAPQVLDAMRAGYRVFAENRPQELVAKTTWLSERMPALEEVPSDLPRFDMIGNLQTNKINAVLGRARLIHSISSLHLARAVSERAERKIEAGELASPQDVLLEVNVSGEASKSGFAPVEVRSAISELVELPGIRVRGLMTMAPRGDKGMARSCFSDLRELRDELEGLGGVELPELSCGMSEDFEEALKEGSTIVRLGRVVFDPSFEVS